ncbi:MAG: cation transporting ATPase C-terminal domain-containing protein, partial [Ruminococcus sp.]|nr:cation transporting ATPase C-terminal domain-containing protein [Ruminococcus sp.]
FGSCLMSLLMTTVVIYVPFLANAFDFQTIDLMEYAVALALAFAIIPLVEIVKAIERTIDKRKAKK